MNFLKQLRMLQWGSAVLVVSLLSGTALAQKPETLNEEYPEFKISGTIKNMVPGYLQVETGKEGEEEVWVVQVLPNNRGVRFIGSAEPDWLMPGLWVNFTTRFNSKGQAVDPVKLISVFTPGAYRGRDVEPYQPGVKSLVNPGAEISFSGEEKVKPKTDTALFEVTGLVKGVSKSGLILLAGNIPVQVSLAEELNISVDLADLRPTRVGDKVEITGRTVAPLKGIATRVEVKGTEPLSSKPSAVEVKTKPLDTEKKITKPDTPETGGKKLPLLGQKPTEE